MPLAVELVKLSDYIYKDQTAKIYHTFYFNRRKKYDLKYQNSIFKEIYINMIHISQADFFLDVSKVLWKSSESTKIDDVHQLGCKIKCLYKHIEKNAIVGNKTYIKTFYKYYQITRVIHRLQQIKLMTWANTALCEYHAVWVPRYRRVN